MSRNSRSKCMDVIALYVSKILFKIAAVYTITCVSLCCLYNVQGKTCSMFLFRSLQTRHCSYC